MTLRFRFGKDSRLTHPSEFQAVFADAHFRFSRGPLLLLAQTTQLGRPRLGLVMRRKNLRRACDRNLVKRLVRENFRCRQHQLPSVDIIVMSRGALGDQGRPQLHSDILWMLDKLADTAK